MKNPTSLSGYLRLSITFAISIVFTSFLFAQAPNDLCTNASEITIPDNNYGLGLFTSETFTVDGATAESGTYFLDASGHDRDIWFSFELPTSRSGKLELFQVSQTNSASQLGFTTYLRSSNVCPPPSTWVDPAKLTPVPQQGSTNTECLDPGSYLVQVTLAPDATGEIYLELTLGEPFENSPGAEPVYDELSEAALLSAPSFFDIGCQTIDSDEEFDCFPIDNPEFLNQSLWWKIPLIEFPEYLSIEFGLTINSTNINLPEMVGFKLFQGGTSSNDWTSLPQIGVCDFLDVTADSVGTNRMYKEIRCEDLQSNGEVILALYFPAGYNNNNVSVKTCQRGGFKTGAPRPILSQMNPDNIKGILPSSFFGETTTVIDTFTCSSSLLLPENQCGSVNPAGFVSLDYSGETYQLAYSSWVSFELAEDAEVELGFPGVEKYRFLRLFSTGITNNCNNINTTTDLLGSFRNHQSFNCLPAGQYAVQILGGNAGPSDWNCNSSMLGKEFHLEIKVTDELPINQFSMVTPNSYEKINDLLPLETDTIYQLSVDVFGCPNTVQVESTTCPSRPKIMVREFVIDQEGLLKIKGLATHIDFDFHHELYSGSISELAIAQNAFTENDVITNAVNLLGGCIDDTTSTSANNYCMSPGRYSLVSFGGDAQRGISISPNLIFHSFNTKFDNPDFPDDLGDLTVIDTLITQLDTFSCGHNPMVIDGLAPCPGHADVQQLYRVFYLSEQRRVRIISFGGSPFNLFEGNVANGINTLSAWTGENIVFDQWEPCRIAQKTSDCDMLGPGYYTLVAYGETASYETPALQTLAGSSGSMGRSQGFELILEPPLELNCNLPGETCFANDGNLTDWNDSNIDLPCPSNTKETYVMDTVYLNCLADTPFSAHPIEACDIDDTRVAYFGFKLSEISMVTLNRIPSEYRVKIYDFDATQYPELLVEEDPIYPCMAPNRTARLFCNVQPGTYTVVIFATYEDRGKQLIPILTVDRVLESRFDHWANAYDFGLVPVSGQTIDGKIGDISPIDPSLPASTDYLSCQTTGSPTDPIEGLCCTEYNPLINNEPFNIPYTEDTPSDGNKSLRNIVYTFLLEGAGECTAVTNVCNGLVNSPVPHTAIYKSNSGEIPFEVLQAMGAVDSTLTDGLELVANSSAFPCDSFCTTIQTAPVTFNKTICEEYTSRYYLVVTSTSGYVRNQQISVLLQYQNYPTVEVRFDEFEEAGSAISEDINTTDFNLTHGYHRGTEMSFQCATANATDPSTNCDSEHTVWYHFNTQETGRLHLSYLRNGIMDDSTSTTEHLHLYKAGQPNTVENLIEITQSDFPTDDPDNFTSIDWRRACISPGDYYLYWETCDNDFNIFDLYQPVLLFDEQPGDYCSNAVPIDLDGVGTASSSLKVDCHTIGTEALDGPESYDCLLGPEGYKSSFFVLNLNGPLKRDVTFSALEYTTVEASEIRYRVLPGYCGALTPGLCSPDINTSFTLNCLDEGSYIIQVVTPEYAEGILSFAVEAIASPDQDCIPLDPLATKATFSYNSCEGDTIFFENQSTFGEDIIYEWTFPDYTSTESHPSYFYPRPDEIEYITVGLQVTNIVSGDTDFIEIEVEIAPSIAPLLDEDIYLCEDSIVTITAKSLVSNAEFYWSTGYQGASVEIDEPGMVYVDVVGIRCPEVDSILVVEAHCDYRHREECDSVYYDNKLFTLDSTFVHFISGDPDLDTLRDVKVIVNGVEYLSIDPDFLEIEVGDEIELNAYTSADSPIYTWFPLEQYDLIRDHKISARPPTSTVFSVLVEDINGCTREAESVIKVAAIYDDVYIPNAFSPNGDGINDYFHPYGAEHLVEISEFIVFDRWGSVVFQNNNIPLNEWREGWDGYVKGKYADIGVYTYFAQVEYVDGKVVTFKGDVTLMR